MAVEIVMASASVALAILTLMLWKATCELGNVTGRLADIAESGQELSHRPWLVVVDVNREGNSSYRFRIKNIGRGAAKHIGVNVGNRGWQIDPRNYATRKPSDPTFLEPGQEGEWHAVEQEAYLVDGRLPISIVYQGFLPRPGPHYQGSWASYYIEDGTFLIQ